MSLSHEEVECGFKRKGTTAYVLVDGNGYPAAVTRTAANADVCQHVEPLLDRVRARMETMLERLGKMPIGEADKVYDTDELTHK